MYGCTIWTLKKRMKKKQDGNYTRMLRAVQNKSWVQHCIKQQMYGHLPPTSQIIQVRRTRHARSKGKQISDVLLWILTHGRGSIGWPVRNYLHQLCADSGCSLEDLKGAVDDRDGWEKKERGRERERERGRERERESGKCAVSETWWWWWWW